MKPYCLMSESELQEAVAKYIVQQYPDVLFHSDFGSGTKLTKNQAARQKRQNGYRKGWPDMVIAEPRIYGSIFENCSIEKWRTQTENCTDEINAFFSGLFLELKKSGTKLIRDKNARKILKGETKLRKKGDWWNSHIEEQAKVLEQLRERGYVAEFAVGFDEAKRIIDEYLGGKESE